MTPVTQYRHSDEELEDVMCKLKWFNTAKGYGFVRVEGLDADIFLHASILQKQGHPLIGTGAVLKCKISRSNNGFFVENVNTVIEPGETPFAHTVEEEQNGDIHTARGTVKWYDTTKEFGFILPDDGVKDIFVHKSCLKDSDLDELIAGQIVSVTYKSVLKGREALSVKVISNP
ncbi:MAG: cold shock domain-containing protein [Pseudobdellovibrionaceae bacterium]